MGPPAAPAPVYYQQPQQQQPTREDPAIEQARLDELRRQQMQRGRGSTLLVERPAAGDSLLPSVTGTGATMLGTG